LAIYRRIPMLKPLVCADKMIHKHIMNGNLYLMILIMTNCTGEDGTVEVAFKVYLC
jgi:hypothetical protein